MGFHNTFFFYTYNVNLFLRFVSSFKSQIQNHVTYILVKIFLTICRLLTRLRDLARFHDFCRLNLSTAIFLFWEGEVLFSSFTS